MKIIINIFCFQKILILIFIVIQYKNNGLINFKEIFAKITAKINFIAIIFLSHVI